MNTSVKTAIAKKLPIAKPAAVGICPQRAADLLTTLQSEIDSQRLPGAVVLVSRRGKIALFESLGEQDPQSALPMDKASIFRIYSMTKPLVSLAVMMLMEQGRLMLADPVAKYLPEYADQNVAHAVEGKKKVKLHPAIKPATVHDLLRHTAGLTYEFLGTSTVQKQYAEARIGSRQRTNAEFSETLAALPLQLEPGTAWEYSRATDVLGRLVEVISGQTLGSFLRNQILMPLGMVDTAFSVPQAQHHRIAEPFASDPDGGPPPLLIDVRKDATSGAPLESGGGGLVSTAMDYARFLQFMLNRGTLDGVRLLSPQTVDFMTADHLGNMPIHQQGASPLLLPAGHGFGLGFAVRLASGIAAVPGSQGLYYWGGIAGTTFFVDPAQDLFALMMIQAPNQREYYRPLFRSLVYAALVD
jgi:CubicO group peptidase (beta-lactamase class C family)